MQDNTLDRWKVRFSKAAQLLTERLDDPPPLEELAAAAAISPYHFHRFWRALTGETVSQSVLRLRIEASQQMLASGGGSVTEVAMASGFGTPQSFARAFRRQTGVTPTAFRETTTASAIPSGAPEIEILERDRVLVVALRHSGDYFGLNKTYGELWSWADKAGFLAGLQGIYGIPLDDPDNVPVSDLRYEACLALGVVAPPPPFHLLTLPGGETARMRHHGSYAGLEEAKQRMVEDWLLPSGREPADHPIYSHFLNDPDNTAEADLITDLYLPLKA